MLETQVVSRPLTSNAGAEISPPQPSPPLSTQDWEDGTVKDPSPKNWTNRGERFTNPKAKGSSPDGNAPPRISQGMGQSVYD